MLSLFYFNIMNVHQYKRHSKLNSSFTYIVIYFFYHLDKV